MSKKKKKKKNRRNYAELEKIRVSTMPCQYSGSNVNHPWLPLLGLVLDGKITND